MIYFTIYNKPSYRLHKFVFKFLNFPGAYLGGALVHASHFGGEKFLY